MVDREVFKLTTEVYAFSFSMHPPLILPMYLYGFCNIFWFLQLSLYPQGKRLPQNEHNPSSTWLCSHRHGDSTRWGRSGWLTNRCVVAWIPNTLQIFPRARPTQKK